MPLAAACTGRTEAHLCDAADGAALGARVHADVVAPLRALREAARAEGFDLALASGFRSFERQLGIWNRKVAGELPVLDDAGRPLDIARLSPRALAFAILRWSALPGASRHHWGTDVDVYDAAATPAGYAVQLVPAEVDAGGMHAPLHAWLDARIAAGEAFGFHRPYDVDRGGVAPERWHLSHAPVARDFAGTLTREVVAEALAAAPMRLREVVLASLDEIVARFVHNVAPPPAGAHG